MNSAKAKALHEKWAIIPYSEAIFDELGHYKYTSKIDNIDAKHAILEASADIFAFSITIVDDNSNYFELCKILSCITYSRIGVTWESVSVMKFADCVLFYPIIKSNYLYLTEEESMLFLDIDCDDFYKKCFLGEGSLWAASAKDHNCFLGVDVIHGISVYSDLNFEIIPRTEIDQRLDICRHDVHMLNSLTRSRIDNPMWCEIASELSLLWDDYIVYRAIAGGKVSEVVEKQPLKEKKIEKIQEKAPFHSKTETRYTWDYGKDFNDWIQDVILRIVCDKIPYVITEAPIKNPYITEKRVGNFVPLFEIDNFTQQVERKPLPYDYIEKAENWIVGINGKEFFVKGENREDVIKRWEKGEYCTDWGCYLLAEYNHVSIKLMK